MGDTIDLVGMTASIVSAYVAKNTVDPTDLPELIASVHAALKELHDGETEEQSPPEPAVPVAQSITDDYLICLEDGQKFKSLKRHLRSQYDMTPEDYRARWGLPADYPMVAPNYAKERSALAKKLGLGRTAAAAPRTKAKGPK